MNLRQFFIGRSLVIVLLLLVGFGIYMFKAESPKQEGGENTTPPVFTWSFEKAETLNLDGIPNTNVFLEAKYDNGEVQTKLIDTSAGGCNELPDAEEDSVAGTANAQCYGAGLGHKFKITKGEKAYVVQRKTFEEALPDYNPPPYEYEVIAEFLLAK